jgi:hypothetical protein
MNLTLDSLAVDNTQSKAQCESACANANAAAAASASPTDQGERRRGGPRTLSWLARQPSWWRTRPTSRCWPWTPPRMRPSSDARRPIVLLVRLWSSPPRRVNGWPRCSPARAASWTHNPRRRAAERPHLRSAPLAGRKGQVASWPGPAATTVDDRGARMSAPLAGLLTYTTSARGGSELRSSTGVSCTCDRELYGREEATFASHGVGSSRRGATRTGRWGGRRGASRAWSVSAPPRLHPATRAQREDSFSLCMTDGAQWQIKV